jgi:hypothetical protein
VAPAIKPTVNTAQSKPGSQSAESSKIAFLSLSNSLHAPPSVRDTAKLLYMPAALTTSPQRRHRIAIGTAFGAIALGILAAALLLDSEPDHPDVSSHFKVCLLTSANSPDTDPVWRGVQASAGAGSINAQKLVVPNDAINEAGPYVASLIASQCRLIVADGTTLSADLQAVASINPATKFVSVGTPVTLPNVRNIPYPVTEPSRITEEVLAAQRAAG